MVSFDVGMERAKEFQKILRLLPQVDLLFVSSEEAACSPADKKEGKSFLQFQRAARKKS